MLNKMWLLLGWWLSLEIFVLFMYCYVYVYL